MYEAELSQLIAMGVGKAQGRAALEMTKGDVMSACEKVFDGRFDHITEDEEEEQDEDGEEDDGDGDDEGAYPFSDEEGEEEYMNYEQNDNGPVAASSDPYAGIFFSKSRVEEAIEITEPIIKGRLSIPSTSGGEVFRDYEILSQGEWMSGCPEGSEQSYLFQLYLELSEGEMGCHGPAAGGGCGHKFQREKKDFFAVLPTFEDTLSHIRQTIHRTCPSCHSTSCLACGERIDDSGKGKKRMLISRVGENDTDNASVWPELFHCVAIQGVLVGVGLHTIEKFFEASSRPSSSPPPPRVVPAKRKGYGLSGMFGDDDDDPSPTTAHKGVGYSGATHEDTTGQVLAKAQQKKKDAELMKMLKDVRVFLPDHDRTGGSIMSDAMPHPATLAHLRRRFNSVATTLLKNDSLSDQSERQVLYLELIQWLLTVSRHEALASLLAMPHMRIASTTSTTKADGTTERLVRYEGTDSPREMLENIVIQCTSLLRGMTAAAIEKEKKKETFKWKSTEKKEGEEGKAEEMTEKQTIVTYCQRVVDTAAAIDRALAESKGQAFMVKLKESLPKLPEKGNKLAENAKLGATEEETRQNYIEWATKSRFEYTDLRTSDGSAFHHKFSQKVVELEGAAPKRTLAIAKELAVLTVNLPTSWESSVFLRVDETRGDCIKALIVGPEGTPYANGCLVFDIFLPYDYNTNPPLCNIVTTRGGQYRLNPNLYAEGKVCLSLLGTWSGPSWISGRSTLLQVLISIQSLILVEHPYNNEPGWEGHEGRPEELAYNANIRRMIVHLMADSISDPPVPFKDVIHTHFRLKCNSLRLQLDKWELEDDGRATQGEGAGIERQPTSAGRGFKADLARLRDLLDKLENGENALRAPTEALPAQT